MRHLLFRALKFLLESSSSGSSEDSPQGGRYVVATRITEAQAREALRISLAANKGWHSDVGSLNNLIPFVRRLGDFEPYFNEVAEILNKIHRDMYGIDWR